MTSVSSGGAMLQREEESDAEVRREDQDNINKFARLNGRLHELRSERDALKVRSCVADKIPHSLVAFSLFNRRKQKQLERMDDASTELMMGSGDKVMIFMGEAFFEATEEEATEFCESQVEKDQGKIDALDNEENDILEQQAELKKSLYGRFGKSIQLEE